MHSWSRANSPAQRLRPSGNRDQIRVDNWSLGAYNWTPMAKRVVRRSTVPASTDATGDSLATQTLDRTRPRGISTPSEEITQFAGGSNTFDETGGRSGEGLVSGQTPTPRTGTRTFGSAAPPSIQAVTEGRRAGGPPNKDQVGPPKPLGPGEIPPEQRAARDAGEAFGFGQLGPQTTPGTPGRRETFKDRRRGENLESLAGSIDEEGVATPPDILPIADRAITDLDRLSEDEIARANTSLDATRDAAAGREGRTETDIEAGIEGAEDLAQRGEDIAQQGKEDVAGLPDRVAADIEGIADRYRQDTDVDVDRIEGLGREAVGMAMQGKNAAAEAAVAAQQGALRQAISQINADPNIPQSRKTAMIAQIRTQGAMSIAAVVGANIKDFTAMQVGAMTSTMNAVGAALVSRNQSLAVMGTAEINAISSAHQTVAEISKGYDDLAMNASTMSAQLTFQYNNLRNTARDMNNATDLAILNDDHYVGGMPYDFRMMDYNMTRSALTSDFKLKLEASAYNTMREAAAAGEQWAKDAFVAQMLAEALPGPWGPLLALDKIGAFDTFLEGLL